jgi:hypothetical protein
MVSLMTVRAFAHDIITLVPGCSYGNRASSGTWRASQWVTLCLFTWKLLPGSDLPFPGDKFKQQCSLLSLHHEELKKMSCNIFGMCFTDNVNFPAVLMASNHW